MSSIDDRIVKMQFDNAQFEKGISQTNDSLTALSDNLQLPGATDGLNDIQGAANGLDLGSISEGVDRIASAFSVLGVVAVNVLSSLVQDAISAGATLINKVLEPIVSGGQRRALALEQAKFQFRGLGLDIEATMAAALAAVDGTAYGLDAAATAAAQFGASGITAGNGLQESLRSIAGVAAQTGSSYEDVSRIFTSVAGNGRLMGQDLLSLGSRGVNAAATLAKSMNLTEVEVRDLVSEGEISFKQFSDAMNAAFGENAAKANETYTGALSNMRAALSRIGAAVATPGFEAQRKVILAVTTVINGLFKAITPLITAFGVLMNTNADRLVATLAKVNFDQLIAVMPIIMQAFEGVVKAVTSIIVPIKNAFLQMFPPATAKELQQFVRGIKDFIDKLILTKEEGENLQSTFAGFFALLSIGYQIISGVVGVIFGLLDSAVKTEGGLLSFTGTIGDWLVKVNDAIKSGDGLTKFLDGLKTVLAIPIKIVQLLGDGFMFLVGGIDALAKSNGIREFTDDVKSRFSGISKVGQFFKDTFEGLKRIFDNIMAIFAPVLLVVQKAASTLGEKIGEALGKMDFDSALNLINTLLFGGFLLLIKNGFDTLKGAIGLDGVGFVDSIKEVFGQLKDHLSALEAGVNAKTILTIAGAVALLAVSAIALSMVDPIRLGAAMAAMTIMFGQLLGAFALIEKIPTKNGFKKIPVIAGALIILAVAMNVLAIAVTKLAKLDWVELSKGLTGVTVMLGIMVAASRLLGESSIDTIKGAAAILIMAVALRIMVSAVTELAGLSWMDLSRGLVGAAAVMVLLVAFSEKLDNPLKIVPTAIAMVILAGALKLLAMAVGDFSELPMEDLTRGIVGMGLALFVISYAMTAMPKDMIAQSFALVLVAGAIYILAQAFKSMAGLSPEEIALGLIAFGGSLLILTVALNAMEGTIPGAIAMAIAAASMLILAQAMKSFSGMSWDEIGRGLTVLAASLLILVAAVILLSAPIFLLGAAALIIAATALMILAPALVLLGTMSWEAIGIGLAALAAGIIVLALGGVLLIPALPGLLGLAIALTLVGAAILTAAIGVTMFAGALAILANIGAAAGEVITSAIMSFAEQIPLIAAKIGEGVGAFATAISEQGPAIILAITTVLLALIASIIIVIPELINAAVIFVMALVNALVALIPFLVNAGMRLIIGILDGVARNIGKVVEKGTDIVVNFINGVAAAIPRVMTAAANLIISFVNGLADTIRNKREELKSAGLNLADALTGGMSTGLLNGIESVKAAVRKLANAIPGPIKKLLGIASPSKVTTSFGEYVAEGLADGMLNGINNVEKSATTVADSAVNAMRKTLTNLSAAVNTNIDIQPSIRPVLDLSAIKKDSSLISGMLGKQSLSLDNVKASVNTAAVGYEANLRVATDADGQFANAPRTVVNLTQNNSSPKALSSADIYRNTKNQLSVTKGELDK